MNVKMLLTMVVSSILVVLLVSTVVVPLIEDSKTQGDVEYSNNVANHLLMGRDDTGTHTLQWTAGETSYTFDGVSYELNGDMPIVTNTTSFLAAMSSNTPSFLCYVDYNARITSVNYDIDITMGNGTITGTVGSVQVNNTYDWAYVINPEGDYFSSFGTVNSYYITSIDDIVAYYNFAAVMDGEATYKGDAATLSPILTEVGDVYTIAYDGLKVVDNTDETRGVGAFLAPVSVTYHPADMDDANEILSIIPVLIIVGLILGLVATFALNRDD